VIPLGVVSFHFHGYQPGDLVRWTEPDPLKAPRFEERNSPVSLSIGGQRVRGRNWTDAVLHAYGHIGAVLERAAGVASVDIEPQTLAWLLAKDPDGYRRVVAAWEKGVAGLAMTPPFHPILPHHHPLEREALFAMMIDFYAPLLRRQRGRPVGLWLPEAAYSTSTLRDYLAEARRAAGTHEGLPDLESHVHLLADERQVAGGSPGDAWSLLAVDPGMPLAVRDAGLSGDFAFGTSGPEDFATAARARDADCVLIASDLESLLANPHQAERFEGIVDGLRGSGLAVTRPSPPRDVVVEQNLVDFSTWSDHDDQMHEGHTSDTRWTGMRRSDGLVIARVHKGQRMSQLWKHAFGLATEQVETTVRRAARDLLVGFDLERRRDVVRRLAVAYGRHLFQEHYRACGLSSNEVDFAQAADRILGGTIDVEVAAHLARAYVTMLMGLRSDPRFWDNPDTRVTFQNVACLAHALVDVAEAWRRSGQPENAERALRILQANLLEFSEAHARRELSALHGLEGWETTEEAWLASLQSEVPGRSGYDVVRRATLYSARDPLKELGTQFAANEVVADTGHIVGEAHGDWETKDRCEHRPS